MQANLSRTCTQRVSATSKRYTIARRHKHRATGGKRRIHQKKRKFEMGRPPSMTKLGAKRVRTIRARGGNQKVPDRQIDDLNFGNAVKSRRS